MTPNLLPLTPAFQYTVAATEAYKHKLEGEALMAWLELERAFEEMPDAKRRVEADIDWRNAFNAAFEKIQAAPLKSPDNILTL